MFGKNNNRTAVEGCIILTSACSCSFLHVITLYPDIKQKNIVLRQLNMSALVFFVQMYSIFKILVVLCVIIDNINILNAQESAIDKDHLKEYPYCGQMQGTKSKTEIEGRTVNSKDSENTRDRRYRWVALLWRTIEAGKDKQTKKMCSGSVITDR